VPAFSLVKLAKTVAATMTILTPRQTMEKTQIKQQRYFFPTKTPALLLCSDGRNQQMKDFGQQKRAVHLMMPQ
jgi:hypothetical protein